MGKRTFLKPGTRLKLSYGDTYEIIGRPIGDGGGSVVYPCKKVIEKEGEIFYDGILYALKECYPVSSSHVFVRDSNGEIVPKDNHPGGAFFLRHVKDMQLRERELTQSIYQTASRMLPIIESGESAEIQVPHPGADGSQDDAATIVNNVYTVMESLSSKGHSLHSYIRAYGNFSPLQAFQVIRQLLFSLREIHQAGYLHLDIQDGNIFLKGTLEHGDDSEILTLIDFGCARKMVDGKTEPITDKVIFTTEGFSAPEILLHNDGSLCLGPEADFYSVGCLLLYLLTGGKYDEHYLIHNKTGKYLTNFKLRKIACPKHLVDRMQEIIAHALKTDPSKRYHSADEMLEDVSDFINALQPYRSDLASVSYDAFICYKHGDIDSAAARALQQRLEHFRVSKKISAGRHPFRRVFVDEGELSSCADFGEQVRAALQNSGWLIVVCSRETPLSPWVNLEIDTFLKYHDRSRILAVLTDGEPEDSFPEKLLEGAEVLAADARGSDKKEVLKKLKGDSVLKLVAPMLGVPFDTLKQRQRTYRYQKIATATSVLTVAAVLFSIYAYRQTSIISLQANELEEEYRQTLLSQSEYYVENAKNEIADNNLVGALESLVMALPSESEDRPLVTDAEYMLVDLLSTYKTPKTQVYDWSDKTATVTDYLDCGDVDSDWAFDPDNRYIFLVDSGGNTIWVRNSDDFSLVQTICFDEIGDYLRNFPERFIVTDDQKIVAWVGSSILCIDYLSGEELWEIPDIADDGYDDAGLAVALSEDGSRLFVVTSSQVSVYNVDSGEVLNTLAYDMVVRQGEWKEGIYSDSQIDEEGTRQPEMGDAIAVSSDGSLLAFSTWQAYLSDGEYYVYPETVYIADFDAGTVIPADGDFENVRDFAFYGDSLFVIGTTGQSYDRDQTMIDLTGLFTAYCVDAHSGSRTWTVSTEATGEFGFEFMEIAESPYAFYEGDVLFAVVDSKFMAVSAEDGMLLQEYDFTSPVKNVEFLDGYLLFIHENGEFSWLPFYEENSRERILSRSLFADDIVNVKPFDDCFVVFVETDSSQMAMIKYQLDKVGDGYQDVVKTDFDVRSNFENVGNGWSYSFSPDEDVLYVVDCAGATCHAIEMPSVDGIAFGDCLPELLGLSEDGSELAFEVSVSDDDGESVCRIYRVDLESETVKGETLDFGENESVQDVVYSDKTVYVLTSSATITEYELSIADENAEHASYNKLNVYVEKQGEAIQFLNQVELKKETRSISYRNVEEDGDGNTTVLASEQDEVLDATEEYLASSAAFDADGGILSFGIGTSGDERMENLRFVDVDVNTGKVREIRLEDTDIDGISLDMHILNEGGTVHAIAQYNQLVVFDSKGAILYENSGEQEIKKLLFSGEESLWVLAVLDGSAYELHRVDLMAGTVEETISLNDYTDVGTL